MRLGGLHLIGLLALAIAMPSSAASAPFPQAPDREPQPPTASALIYLGHADGYDIAVSNPNPFVAILYVGQEAHHRANLENTQASYAVRPQASIGSGVLRARFGSMGRVALRFRPDGRMRIGQPTKHCSGRRPRTESGTYLGHVSLRGEGGYFSFHTEKATGDRTRTFRLSCTSGHAYKPKPMPLSRFVAPYEGFRVSSGGGSTSLLLANSRSNSRYVYLRAAHMQGEDEQAGEVQASTLERRGSMAIGRNAFVGNAAGALLTSAPGERPASATVAPPSPFRGKGDYVGTSSKAHSWSGTLAVRFPGLDLPLVGPTYSTGLCVLDPLEARLPCDFQRPPLVANDPS